LVLGDFSRGSLVRTAVGVVPRGRRHPAGHKVALRAIAAGAPVRKYGEVIGVAREGIRPGAPSNWHNLGVGRHTPTGAPLPGAPRGLAPPAAPTRDHFLGYRRATVARRHATT